MIYPINHLPEVIPVGVQTENGVEVIGFDLKPWLDALPDMDFSVWHTRPGENEAYPVNDHMMIGTVLYWHPDGYDTALAGGGRVEIAGVGDNQRKLSGFVATSIRVTSLVATKEPGENAAPWYEAVLQAAQDVKADVDVGTGGLFLVNVKNSQADRTQDEIRAAVAAGKTCLLTDDFGMGYTYYEETTYPSDPSETRCPTFTRYERTPDGIAQYEARVLSTGEVIVGWFNGLCATPNPWHLVFDGLGLSYNGSKQVRVKIPVIADPADKKSAAYLRWNGTGYAPATVESVKAELGAGGTVEVDATLTKENAAADAKVVGDRFTSLSEEMVSLDGFIPYMETREIHVGENLFDVANLTLGAGWSYADGVMTHTAGQTEDASLAFDGADGENYLLEFTTSHSAGEFITAVIGSGYPNFAYNGSANIVMPLKCWGTAVLTIAPVVPVGSSATVGFAMSNIRLRRIQDEGDAVTLNFSSAITQQNAENYGNRNVILGYNSATRATGSTRLVALGNSALMSLKGGHRNIAIGGSSLQNMVGGNQNIAIGADAAIYMEEGEGNFALGVGALGFGKKLVSNVAIGDNAQMGSAESEAANNIAIGTMANYNCTANENVAIGYKAGYSNRTGKNNVFVGSMTFSAQPGNYNVFVGSGAYNTAAGCNESIGIGHAARPTKSNQMVLGGTMITEVVFCGNKKIIFNNDGTVTWEPI